MSNFFVDNLCPCLKPKLVFQKLASAILLKCEALFLLKKRKPAIAHERLGESGKEHDNYEEAQLICSVAILYLLHGLTIVVNGVQERTICHHHRVDCLWRALENICAVTIYKGTIKAFAGECAPTLSTRWRETGCAKSTSNE